MAKFPGTDLASRLELTDIRKADLSLLEKINQLSIDTDAALVPINTTLAAIGTSITASLVKSSATALISNVAKTLCFIDIPPGIWNISGWSTTLLQALTSIQARATLIGLVTNTIPPSDTTGVPTNGEIIVVQTLLPEVPGAQEWTIPTGSYTQKFTITTRLYLLAYAFFSVAGCSAYGSIQAVKLHD